MVAAAFTERFTVHTGHEATAVSESGGAITVEARPYEDGEGVLDRAPVTVTGDELLVAAGPPNTDRLAVEETGVETDDRGFVETDEYLRATAEGV